MAAVGLLTQEETRAFIFERVWEGILGFEDIRECVLSKSCELDSWVENEISRQLIEKRQAEKAWPGETDCDKLAKVFNDLEKLLIISLQAPGDNLTGCFGAAWHIWAADGAETSEKIGYVLYSLQCVKDALHRQSLSLSFGVIPPTTGMKDQRLTDHDVAVIVIDVMKEHGLQGYRGGPNGQSIIVEPFVWQKRTPQLRN
jgi:hypothetical protein